MMFRMMNTRHIEQIRLALRALTDAVETSDACEGYADAARLHVVASRAQAAAAALAVLTEGAWIEAGGARCDRMYSDAITELTELLGEASRARLSS